jgi:hypothetical protein
MVAVKVSPRQWAEWQVHRAERDDLPLPFRDLLADLPARRDTAVRKHDEDDRCL